MLKLDLVPSLAAAGISQDSPGRHQPSIIIVIVSNMTVQDFSNYIVNTTQTFEKGQNENFNFNCLFLRMDYVRQLSLELVCLIKRYEVW